MDKFIIDKESSKKNIKTKDKLKLTLIKTSKNIMLSTAIFALFTSCAPTNQDIRKDDSASKIKSEQTISISNNDDMQVQSSKNDHIDIEYILIPSETEGKYYYYHTSDLLIGQDKKGVVRLKDIRDQKRDLFGNTIEHDMDVKTIKLFKYTDLYNDIYMDNIDSVISQNGEKCMIISKEYLKEYIDRLNGKGKTK